VRQQADRQFGLEARVLAAPEARDIITAGRGNHFDPDAADAFLQGFDAFAGIASSYLDAPTP